MKKYKSLNKYFIINEEIKNKIKDKNITLDDLPKNWVLKDFLKLK